MGAFQGLPVVEAVAAFGRNVFRTAMTVDVPLADPGRVVAFLGEGLPQARAAVGKGHVVDENAVGQGVLAGEQTTAPGGTNRPARHRVGEIDAFPREPVQMRRGDLAIPGVTRILGAPLIGEYKDDVGSVHAFTGSETTLVFNQGMVCGPSGKMAMRASGPYRRSSWSSRAGTSRQGSNRAFSI